jgi:hypothetical protein
MVHRMFNQIKKALIYTIQAAQWYWYCSVCGHGPYSHHWDSCGLNGCKGKRPDSDD